MQEDDILDNTLSRGHGATPSNKMLLASPSSSHAPLDNRGQIFKFDSINEV